MYEKKFVTNYTNFNKLIFFEVETCFATDLSIKMILSHTKICEFLLKSF